LQELIEVLFQEQKLFRLTTVMNFLEKQSVFTALTHWMNGNDEVTSLVQKTTAGDQ
jgi:hypothetical protein